MKRLIRLTGETINRNQAAFIKGGAPRPPWENPPYDPSDPELGGEGYGPFCYYQCPNGSMLSCGSGTCSIDMQNHTLTCNGIINYC